jgi:hypothetical protein
MLKDSEICVADVLAETIERVEREHERGRHPHICGATKTSFMSLYYPSMKWEHPEYQKVGDQWRRVVRKWLDKLEGTASGRPSDKNSFTPEYQNAQLSQMERSTYLWFAYFFAVDEGV